MKFIHNKLNDVYDILADWMSSVKLCEFNNSFNSISERFGVDVDGDVRYISITIPVLNIETMQTRALTLKYGLLFYCKSLNWTIRFTEISFDGVSLPDNYSSNLPVTCKTLTKELNKFLLKNNLRLAKIGLWIDNYLSTN